MQLDSRRGGSTQDILEGQNLVLVIRRQVGFLLLENGEGQHITRERDREKEELRNKEQEVQ